MHRSRAVRIGALVTLFAASLACADGEDTEVVQTQYGEICVRREPPPAVDQPFMQDEPQLVRVPWEDCEKDSSHTHFYPYWINHASGHAAPPVGSRVVPGSGTATRPASGAVARPPSTGGFGTHTTTIGG